MTQLGGTDKEGLNEHQREVKCDKDTLIMNEKEYNRATILNFLLLRTKALAPSYIKSGKTPPRQEPLKSTLELTQLSGAFGSQEEERREKCRRWDLGWWRPCHLVGDSVLGRIENGRYMLSFL